MKAIILAGGYAKRLWPLTKDTPKPLLMVGNKEIITRIIEKLEDIKEIDELVISTNAKFENKFKHYLQNITVSKQCRLVVEPSMGEGEKLGSIGGLNYLIDHLGLDDDVLVIGGDNIFEFSLRNFIDYYSDKDASVIALKKIEDRALLKKYGVCVLGKDELITDFQEKSDKPVSDLASTACYIFTYSDMMLIKKYLAGPNPPDAMGFFISWLISNASVYGYVFEEDWYDIGSFEQLDGARERYGQ
ncbi:NTP transferase domain-containing protein [Candidatus Woesearchaeota archaeon]|nr:NTP transferase domain-containing protein [Candidatus Woesearchaeota archaeon]